MCKARLALATGVAICFCFALVVPAPAQITSVANDQATPLPGVGHDYIKMLSETVQPASGQLSVRVDVPTRPGRGLTIPFAFLYNSPGVHHVVGTGNGHALWVSDTADNLGQGWSTNAPTLSAVQQTLTVNFPGPPPYTASCVYFTSYIFQDSTGARHALPLQTAQSSDIGSPNHCSQAGAPSNVLSGGDGVYNAVTTAPTPDVVPLEPTAVTVVGPDGTTYYFGQIPMIYDGWTKFFRSTSSSIGERNGNSMGIGGGGVDTLGGSSTPIPFTTTSESVSYSFSSNSEQLGTLHQANCFNLGNGRGTLNVYQAITLPNGEAYQFQYDSMYGLLSKITYPTGGYVSYSWGPNPFSESIVTYDVNGLACYYEYDTPAITHRYVSFDGVNIALQQDFTYSPTTWNGGAWTSKQTTVTTRDLIRGTSFQTVYNYLPSNTLAGQQNALEQSIVYKDFNGTVLKTVTKGWGYAVQAPSTQLVCELDALNNGSISGVFYSYGLGSEITDKKEYDYGLISSASSCYGHGSPSATAPSGITPTRETAVTYQSFPATLIFPYGPSIFDRPATVMTYGNGTLLAETDFAYDQSNTVGVSPPAINHDETDYGPTSTAARGNATTITRKCLQGCSNAVSTYIFYETGQVQSKTDPCGNATCADMSGTNHTTTYSYADNYSSCGGSAPTNGSTNAYLTKITDALGHISTFCYGYADGQLISSTDPNSQVTSYIYADPLHRPTETDFADGGKTLITYNDATYNASTPSPSVTTTKLGTPSPNITTLTAFDGLGQTVRSVLTSDPDCSSGDRTDTTYDGLGRVYKVSNPYCTTGDQTYGLTTYTYDAFGRTTQVAHPDGSTILTTYTGRATLVQDEGNGTQRVTRVSQTDGLGRLSSVCEVSSGTLIGQNGTPAACGQDIAQTGFLTSYLYDSLDNLNQVNQGTMTPRMFAYDSLSRLTSASNPESGSTTYSYDANGNLSTKKDARNITTTYSYDSLNRNTQKSYSDGTPTATFVYDVSNINGVQVTNPLGRLVDSAVGSCTFTVNSYDPMGRVVGQYENIPSCSYPRLGLVYGYDLAGNMTSASNGEFQTFTFGYNGAARLISLTSSVSDSQHPPNLMSGAHYNALGEITSDSLGNGETEAWTYNDIRGRMTAYTATLSGTSIYSLTIPNGGYAPNSNILAANDSVNGNWTYSYDPFNRLTGSNKGSGAAVFSYVYDRFGNRWQQNGPNTFIATFTGNNPANPQNNNRIDGYSYDAAGNLLNDGVHSYTYDAENRITQVDAGATAIYTYDALGQRVEKTTASRNNECGTSSPSGTVFYVYDLSGHIGVYTADGTNSCMDDIFAAGRHLATYAGDTQFIHSDWLGTERVRRYYANHVSQTCTSNPFGDALSCGGNPTNSSPLHFTGKQRDFESGLDNFGARYDSSSMGRFMSPDPIYIEATKLADPQQLNLYAYVRNNPLNLTDPTGMLVDVNCQQVTAAQCSQTVTDFNNRQGAQFQVTRDDKTGQLNVSGDVDVSKLSDGERALYNAITDTSATGTLNVVGNDPSFDFEKYSSPGQNTVDRSDLNALNGADKRLSGEILAHAALESFQSATLAATEPDLSSAKIGQIAHDRARKLFGFALDKAGWQPNTTGPLVTAPSLNFRATRLNEDFRVTTTLKTPIPLASFNTQGTPGARNVTNVSILPPEK